MDKRTFAFVGGLVGLVTFLTVALLPSIVYGGYAGVILSSAILGVQLTGQLLSKAIIVFGMVAGLLSTAGIFVVLGAALGAGAHSVVESLPVTLARKKI